MKLFSTVFALALLPIHAFAADHQFTKGEAVKIDPDQGYILVRTFNGPGGALRGTVKTAPLLIRVLSEQELTQIKALAQSDPKGWKTKVEPNVVEPLADQPFAEMKEEVFLLTSLKPGTYVLGGVAVTNWAVTSAGLGLIGLSMGTVRFEVRLGVITDLGAILVAPDDRLTKIPELSKVVSGKPVGFSEPARTMAVRPATEAMETPEALKSLARVPADYRAQGAFPINYVGAPMSRLAPMPGVLDYDAEGSVIDLKAASGTSP